MNTIINNTVTRLAAFFIGMILCMTPSFAQATLFGVSPDTLTWSANDLTPKEFGVNCFQNSWQADISASQGIYQLDMTEGYDMSIVSVTPLVANTSTSNRHVQVVITRSDGATATLHLIHQGVPVPDPSPASDPWADAADDLDTGRNWIQSTTVTAADGSASFRDIEWYDGLGYRDQTVMVGASTSGRSIVTPVVYDRMRRKDARTYLPFAANLPTGLYRTNAVSLQSSYYSPQDSRPFAETEYEAFPAGRPLSWQREGVDWNTEGGKKITYSYSTNSLPDGIWQYRITPGSNLARYAGIYPAGSLLCTETEGENGNIVRTYSDALGRTVCVDRVPAAGQLARTLYIRDVRDSVAVVVQPEGVKALEALSDKDLSLLSGSGTNHGITDSFCFIRQYDWRGNLLSEHVPGGGTVEYAYDSRNREVLRTDSRMSPEAGGTYKMILTTYDQYDRATQETYVSCTLPIGTMRSLVDHGSSWTMPSTARTRFTVIRPLRTAQYFPFTTFSYPTSGSYAFVAESGFASAPEKVRVKGLLREETLYGAPDLDGSMPSGTPTLTRAYHYDSEGRVIQTIERWSDSWTRRVSTRYTFTGDVLSTKETVTASAGTPHVMTTQYSRDVRGRLLSAARTLDGQALRPVTYAYDALGRLAVRQAGTESFLKTTLQYDIHGWQRLITMESGAAPVFQETLRYATPTAGRSIDPRYDGNLSEITFLHKLSGGNTDTHSWGYEYDLMGRLQSAAHFVGSSTTPSLTDTEQSIAYDRNGNITALKRYGTSGLVNDLSFDHSGNRMTSLTDTHATGSEAGLKNFTYDANGNLTYDGRQDLEIRWNVLNLVSGAETHDDGSLTFSRLSDGTLVARQAVSGGSTAGKRYCGSFVFTTGTGITTPQVESVAWDEGRVFRDSSTGTYRDCWFAGDHLGNVRSVVDISQSLTTPVVLDQNDYLPFGTRVSNSQHAQMGMNRWRYAGKEAFPELNQLDFGARMYDPFTARWTAVDPMAGKYAGMSPFGYCSNNPITIIDEFGLDLVLFGTNDSSVTFRTDLVDLSVNLSVLGIDWKGNYSLDGKESLSAALDLAGFFDPTGIADGANTVLLASGGDYWGAFQSGLSVLHFGDLAKVGKIGKDLRIISDAIGLNNKGYLHRPYIRKWVRDAVEARAPRDELGRFIDINEGTPISGKYDLGHVRGKEFWRLKADAEAKGLTQKEFNDLMNDPKLYQIEDPSINRSRKYEKKD